MQATKQSKKEIEIDSAVHALSNLEGYSIQFTTDRKVYQSGRIKSISRYYFREDEQPTISVLVEPYISGTGKMGPGNLEVIYECLANSQDTDEIERNLKVKIMKRGRIDILINNHGELEIFFPMLLH